jgi:hypothetical protein
MPNMDKADDKRDKPNRDRKPQKMTVGQQNVLPGDKAGVKIEIPENGGNQ